MSVRWFILEVPANSFVCEDFQQTNHYSGILDVTSARPEPALTYTYYSSDDDVDRLLFCFQSCSASGVLFATQAVICDKV
jgi:hypothetical protein